MELENKRKHEKAAAYELQLQQQKFEDEQNFYALQLLNKQNQQREVELYNLTRINASSLIQKSVRIYLARKVRMKSLASLLKLQSFFRGYFVRKLRLKLMHSINTIQNAYKKYYFKFYDSAHKIWKRNYEEIKLNKMANSMMIKIQRFLRSKLASSKYKQTVKKVIKLQSCVRQFVSMKHTCILKAFVAKRKQALLVKSINKIYLAWKNYKLKCAQKTSVNAISRWMCAYFIFMRVKKLNRGFRRLQVSDSLDMCNSQSIKL